MKPYYVHESSIMETPLDELCIAAVGLDDAHAAIRKAQAEGKVEALREAADHIESEYYLADDGAEWMRCMADEAEKIA